MKNKTRASIRMFFLCAACLFFGAAATMLWMSHEVDLPEAP